MAEVRNQDGPDDASEVSRTSRSDVESVQGDVDLISPLMVVADDIPRSALPPIERVRFHIAVGVLVGFAAFIAIPLVIWSVSVFVTENRVMTDDIIRMITTLSAATSGLVGAVVGYYFGQNSNA